MDVRILYLDIDDEITSVANRVREAEPMRVAVVVPHGSRVATSRINFRLLARDATLNGKRLSIVAGDAATRALAASAGLPVFSTVTEYESSVEDGGGTRADEAQSAEPGLTTDGAGPGAGGTQAGQPAGVGPGVPSRSPRGSGGRSPRGGSRPASPASDGSPVELTPAAAGAAVGAAIARVPAGPPPRDSEMTAAHRAPASIPAARVIADSTAGVPPAGSRVLGPAPQGRSWPGAGRTPIAIGLAVLALAVLVGGVGAYALLPTATAVIVPRQGTIGPIELRIVADPSLTAPDAEARTVPAVTKPIPVETTQTFEVTGKRVEEVKAKGSVRFRNFDSDEANTIPRGSIVGTRGGIRFRTDRAVTIPRAEQVLFQIFPASATVTITAVEGGPDGNVGQNQIRLIPAGEDPQTTDVNNLEATSGGKRDEFPRVVEKDIEGATKVLQAALGEQFAAAAADPGLSADGTTVFPATAELGEVSYSVDPASLLDQEVETFELGARATGTVLAVDEAAVQQVAEANIEPQVEQGYTLIDGSSQVRPSPGVVEEGVISFPVTITAQQVLQVDPDAIEAEIRGKSLADAQAILDGYGQAQLSVWPDWVATVPTLDARVEVRMAVDVAS